MLKQLKNNLLGNGHSSWVPGKTQHCCAAVGHLMLLQAWWKGVQRCDGASTFGSPALTRLLQGQLFQHLSQAITIAKALRTCEMHVVNEPVLITVRNILFFKVHGVKKVYEGLAMRGSAPLTHFFPLGFLDPFLFWSKGTSLFLGDQTAEAA